jgi:hypothetical protein
MPIINSRTVKTKSFQKRCAGLPLDIRRLIIKRRVEIDVYAWIKTWGGVSTINNERPDDCCFTTYGDKQYDFLDHIETKYGVRFRTDPKYGKDILSKAHRAEKKIQDGLLRGDSETKRMIEASHREAMEDRLHTLSLLGGRLDSL